MALAHSGGGCASSTPCTQSRCAQVLRLRRLDKLDGGCCSSPCAIVSTMPPSRLQSELKHNQPQALCCTISGSACSPFLSTTYLLLEALNSTMKLILLTDGRLPRWPALEHVLPGLHSLLCSVQLLPRASSAIMCFRLRLRGALPVLPVESCRHGASPPSPRMPPFAYGELSGSVRSCVVACGRRTHSVHT